MRSIAGAALFIVPLVLAACEQSTPPADVPRDRGAAEEHVSEAPLEISAVSWPADAMIDRAALAALPDKTVRMARTSRVPVLVPRRRELLAAPVIVVKEHWTSVWARTKELTVSLTMTRLARKYETIQPIRGPHDVRGKPAFITSNEGIWSASWIENGVSYTLDVECASPDAPACASDALLRELASELVYVGGAGAGAANDKP